MTPYAGEASGVVACPTTPEPQGHQQSAGPFSARPTMTLTSRLTPSAYHSMRREARLTHGERIWVRVSSFLF
jgi:hypothetical protein